MKTILFVILSLFVTVVQGQHYYNDIKTARILSDRMKSYVSNKVSLITATGYDENGTKSRDFNEWHYVQADKYILRIVTRNGQEIARQRNQFDANFRLLSINDTARQMRSSTVYT